MAVDESGFKAGFKKDLMGFYPSALIWTNSDMFRAGLPDMSAMWDNCFFGMELKFIKTPPKRQTSMCLKHEVTPAQLEFLHKARANGGYSCVVIGMQDVAVFTMNLKENYTLDEVLNMTRINRLGKFWDLKFFFNSVRGYNGQG